MAVRAKTREATECRQCCAFCDKMIEPRGCIEMGCPFLYTYEDQAGGHRYMGCLQKVFAVEIDVDMFEKAERTRQGFGGIKAASEPLAMCPMSVERSYEGQGGAFTCTNPRFFDASEDEIDGYRAFDLRAELRS